MRVESSGILYGRAGSVCASSLLLGSGKLALYRSGEGQEVGSVAFEESVGVDIGRGGGGGSSLVRHGGDGCEIVGRWTPGHLLLQEVRVLGWIL
jgi:hypothetical protein